MDKTVELFFLKLWVMGIEKYLRVTRSGAVAALLQICYPER